MNGARPNKSMIYTEAQVLARMRSDITYGEMTILAPMETQRLLNAYAGMREALQEALHAFEPQFEQHKRAAFVASQVVLVPEWITKAKAALAAGG